MRTLLLLTALAAFAMAADFAGKWTFQMETEGGPRTIPATFAVDAGNVTGKWGADQVKGTVRDGKLELRFPITSSEAGATADLHISGTLDGDAIKGTWQWSEHGGTFKATRSE